MRLRNFLIVTKDIDRAVNFYRDLSSLQVLVDYDGNVIMSDGLVLQAEEYWKKFLAKDIVSHSNSCELYFEEPEIEAFVEKLESYYPDVEYVNRLMSHEWGQKVVRFYDPDGNLIEVGTPF
ncbi:MAG: VOC family protein [Eubacterium sp.]|nr:VOC family protein [Candidatus Colimonas fimequi]